MVEDNKGNRMNRSDFLKEVAKESGESLKTVTKVYNVMVKKIIDLVANGDSLSLRGFGKFYSRMRKGHPVQFVEGGEKTYIEPYVMMRFSPSKEVSRRLRSTDIE